MTFGCNSKGGVSRNGINAAISVLLSRLRFEHSYSQELVASTIGVDVTTYRRWERGEAQPSLQYFPQFSGLYGYEFASPMQDILNIRTDNVDASNDWISLNDTLLQAASTVVQATKDHKLRSSVLELLLDVQQAAQAYSLHVKACMEYR